MTLLSSSLMYIKTPKRSKTLLHHFHMTSLSYDITLFLMAYHMSFGVNFERALSLSSPKNVVSKKKKSLRKKRNSIFKIFWLDLSILVRCLAMVIVTKLRCDRICLLYLYKEFEIRKNRVSKNFLKRLGVAKVL